MFKVKILDRDEKTLFSYKRIHIKDSTFETPIKAINARNLLDVEINHKQFIAEVYRVLRKDLLSKIISNEAYNRIFNQKLHIEINRAKKFGAKIILFISTLDHLNPQIKNYPLL